MSYAIFRVEPIQKIKDLGHRGAHNQRKKEAYNSNPDIDVSKSKNNIEIVPLSEKYIKGFYNITKDYKAEHDKKQLTQREERKKPFHKMVDDSKSVVADELLFTSDFDFFKNMSKSKIRKWADTCMEFVYNDLGYTKDQILHSVLHLDEKTPHLHCVVIPLVRKLDKRTDTIRYSITKKYYIKDKEHLSLLQDKYHQRLVDNGFDLERGIKNSDNEHISIKEFKKITRKLDNRLEKQNYLMTRDYEELEEKLSNSKPAIIGDKVKIDKDTYDTLKEFMNTSKSVIEDMPKNQALFEELQDYTSSYKDLEREKRNIQHEVYRLQAKNKELEQENNRLYSFIGKILQTFKNFFRKILKLGTEKEKDEVIDQITEYHEKNLYKNEDLHDIADNTSREDEVNDYLYDMKYGKDDFDIGI